MDCFALCNTQSVSELILVHTSHNAAHNTSKPDRAVRLRLVLLKLLPSLGLCLAGISSSAYSHDKDRATRKKAEMAAHGNQVAVLQTAFAMACLSVDVCEATLEGLKERFGEISCFSHS